MGSDVELQDVLMNAIIDFGDATADADRRSKLEIRDTGIRLLSPIWRIMRHIDPRALGRLSSVTRGAR